MRILFISGALFGHINPLLPLALAARDAGHDVRFATGPEFVASLERRGLPAWAVGVTHAEAGGNRQESWLTYFEATAHRRAADLLPRVAAWRPDIVVHEETELGGPIVAMATGAQHLVHGLGPMPPRRIWPAFVQAMERLGKRWGHPRAANALSEATYLHLCPPALQRRGEQPIWQRVQPLRPSGGLAMPGDRLPESLDALPHRHTVLLTLGTVYNGNVGVLQRAIAGLRMLQANVVVTVGPDGDPLALGPQPEHVRVERYVPYALLLPRCSLVVSQGGSGTLLGALSLGLPHLLLPQGADQFFNAEVAVTSGTALALMGADATPDAVLDGARRLLAEPAFAAAARHVQSEIAAMPSAVQVVEQLAADAESARACQRGGV
jgi:UDP:flavonoid glycosyltransferase YjiC (YdhE family)